MTWWVCKRCRIGPGIRVFPFEDESIEYRGLCKRCLDEVNEIIRNNITQWAEQRDPSTSALSEQLTKFEFDKIPIPLLEEPVTYPPTDLKTNYPLIIITQPDIIKEEEE